MKPTKRRLPCPTALFLALTLVACSGGDGELPDDATGAAQDISQRIDTASSVDTSSAPDVLPGPDGEPNGADAGDAHGEDVPAVPDTAPTPDIAPDVEAPRDTVADTAPDTARPPFADTDFCEEVEAFGPVYDDVIARWSAQDDLAPPAPGGLLLVGSSSARRWEGFAAAYADYHTIQRGFGGAQLGEVALRTEDLVLRHDPAAVAVFAGTNDVAAGVAPEIVIQRFRCFRQRIGLALGWDRPVLFIAITPTPARWTLREESTAVNEGVRALQAEDPALTYVDVATPFLETGEPPAAHLFVSDELHLSDAGYALWDAALRPAVEAALSPRAPFAPQATPLAPGARIRVDLGPNNAVGEDPDGEHTPSPDYLGSHWNNWHDLDGGGAALAGEHLDELVTTDGVETPIDLVITGGFLSNGWANGGLRWPAPELLGDLTVGSATGDYFYVDGPDMPGGFVLRGLDPDARYTLRLFASRVDDERRVTGYDVTGAEEASTTLQTSGDGAGTVVRDNGVGNDDDVAVLSGLQPDAWGQLFVDVRIVEGSYAYLSLLELAAE